MNTVFPKTQELLASILHVSGISAAVDVPTVHDISDVAGLPYAVYVCYVPIVSTAA
jgi:hypothetical protein